MCFSGACRVRLLCVTLPVVPPEALILGRLSTKLFFPATQRFAGGGPGSEYLEVMQAAAFRVLVLYP